MSKLVPESPSFWGRCLCWNLIGTSEHTCQSPGLVPYCKYEALRELLQVMEIQFDSEDLWWDETPCWNYINVFWITSLSLVKSTDFSTGYCWKWGRATGVALDWGDTSFPEAAIHSVPQQSMEKQGHFAHLKCLSQCHLPLWWWQWLLPCPSSATQTGNRRLQRRMPRGTGPASSSQWHGPYTPQQHKEGNAFDFNLSVQHICFSIYIFLITFYITFWSQMWDICCKTSYPCAWALSNLSMFPRNNFKVAGSRFGPISVKIKAFEISAMVERCFH